MTSAADLYGIHYSPWTEKARWALDYSKVPYRYHEHTILLGMPALRARFGLLRSDLTVPALAVGKTKLTDSFDIAQWADRDAHLLFPNTLHEKIKLFNQASEDALSAARVLMLSKLRTNKTALAAALPHWIPELTRPALSWMASMGAAYVAVEFGVKETGDEKMRAACRIHLDKVRNFIGDEQIKNRKSVFEQFSFADITLAAALHGVRPPESVSMHQALRSAWHDTTLANEYADLVEWRDCIYSQFRRPSA